MLRVPLERYAAWKRAAGEPTGQYVAGELADREAKRAVAAPGVSRDTQCLVPDAGIHRRCASP